MSMRKVFVVFLSFFLIQNVNALEQVIDFGNNPGQLDMYRYVPSTQPQNAALVVVLHGCTQTPEDYDYLTGWSTLAERYGFYALYPKTFESNQLKKCFNWYEPNDYRRGGGEATSIVNMIEKMKQSHSIDPAKIYITGLSAGGVMVLDLMASYPDVFAGGAAWSSVPAYLATSLFGGEAPAYNLFYSRQYVNKTPDAWGDLVRNGSFSLSGYAGPYPKVSLIMSDADERFDPRMLFETIEQWGNLHGVADSELTLSALNAGSEVFRRTKKFVVNNASGDPVVEAYQLSGMAHGSSVDPCTVTPCDEDQGGKITAANGSPIPYTWDWDLWSAFYSAKFLGLIESEPQPLNVKIVSPVVGATVNGTITVSATAYSDIELVNRVEFYVAGSPSATCIDYDAPYTCDVDTFNYAEGSLTIAAHGYAVTEQDSDSIEVTVQNTLPPCTDWEATLSNHVSANPNRAYSQVTGQTCFGTFCFGGTTNYFAVGSNQNLGTNANAVVSLKEEPPGYFVQGSCPTEDTMPPVISLNGSATLLVSQGANFIDPGATAVDNVDGNISADIVVTGSVNTSVIGSYQLTYDVSDAAGNAAATVVRTVNVTTDTTPPVITLNGALTVVVTVGGTYVEPGYSAIDDVDNNLSASVVVGGSVNTNVVGIYVLTYDVSDSSGNAAVQKTRTVNVIEASACWTATMASHKTAGRLREQYFSYYENHNGVNGEYVGSTFINSGDVISMKETGTNTFDKVPSCQ